MTRTTFAILMLLSLAFSNEAQAQYAGQSNFQTASRSVAPASYETSTQPDQNPQSLANSGFPSLVSPAATEQATTEHASATRKSFGPLVTTGFSLVVVLGLFAGLVWVTRRYGNGSMTQTGIPSDVMKSLGSTAIDARTRVTLLRCGNRIIVMAQTASGVHPLSEISDPAEVQRLTSMCNGETVSPASLESEPTFAEALRQANRRGKQPAFTL